MICALVLATTPGGTWWRHLVFRWLCHGCFRGCFYRLFLVLSAVICRQSMVTEMNSYHCLLAGTVVSNWAVMGSCCWSCSRWAVPSGKMGWQKLTLVVAHCLSTLTESVEMMLMKMLVVWVWWIGAIVLLRWSNNGVSILKWSEHCVECWNEVLGV